MKNLYRFSCKLVTLLLTLTLLPEAALALAPDALPAESRLAQLAADNQVLRYCLVLLAAASAAALTTGFVLWRRRCLLQAMHSQIEQKGRELTEIQDQVHQANEELRVINTNLEAIVQERTLKLSKVNRELDMFLYRASHDLRRPITTLMGLVEVSKLGFDEAAARMLFEKINDTAVNMDGMLEKFSMINTINHEEYESAEIDFAEMVEQVRNSSVVSTYAAKITFDIQIDRHIRLVSEPQLLAFVLKNLIANSVIFHSRASGRQPTIRLTIKQLGDTVGVELFDNGIGIPQSMIPEIFHLFYRGSEASKGNGLGLYVVQKAVAKLNGQIHVESKEHEWTRVYMTLPQMEAKTICLNVPAGASASASA